MEVCTSQQSLIDALSCSSSYSMQQVWSEHDQLGAAGIINANINMNDDVVVPHLEVYGTTASTSLRQLSEDTSFSCSSSSSYSMDSDTSSARNITQTPPENPPDICSLPTGETCPHTESSIMLHDTYSKQGRFHTIHNSHVEENQDRSISMNSDVALHRNNTISDSVAGAAPRMNPARGNARQHKSRIKRHFGLTTSYNGSGLHDKPPVSPSSVLVQPQYNHHSMVSPESTSSHSIANRSSSKTNGTGITTTTSTSSRIRRTSVTPFTHTFSLSYHLKMKHYKTITMLPPTIGENDVLQDDVLQLSPQRAFLSRSLLDLNDSKSDDTSSTLST